MLTLCFPFRLSIIFFSYIWSTAAFLSSRKEPLDVRGQAFFEVNCEMVNSLIQKTRTETAIIRLKYIEMEKFERLGSQSL